MKPDYSDSFGYEIKLPEDVREIFMHLCQDVTYIQQIWSFYFKLFEDKDYPEVADLVPATFGIIEETISHDIIMTICRLTDKAKTNHQDNLTFQTLAQKCSFITGVDKLTTDLLAISKPIRNHRDKRIGHNDLNTRIDPMNYPLPKLYRNQVDEVLRIAQKILNTIIQYYDGGELFFELIQMGGADDLIFWLKAGRQYYEDQDSKLFRSSKK